MNSPAIDLQDAQEEYRRFPDAFSTLLLATSDKNAVPEASYAPYIKEPEGFYVYLSELAKHTGNLLENNQCSIFFVQNEKDAASLFARKRLTYACDVIEVSKDESRYEPLLDKFENKFGSIMPVLRGMGDFHLFCLRPRSGSYVAGFAKAYAISGEELDEIRHRNEVGHKLASR